MPDVDSERARDADLLLRTVQEAGALALSLFRTDVKQWMKAGSSPVSDADIAVDELIRLRLQSATPDYGWLSEESVDDRTRLTRQRVWIVDPIDGTRAYLGGREDWSVSVALVEDGQPVIGAVFAPASEEMFFAIRGQGATRNGAAIQTTAGAALDFARMAGPRFLIDRVREKGSPPPGDFKIGSLALRLSRVAQGELDAAFVGGNSRDWDLAAADLLVHEAQGMLTSISGRTLAYNRTDVAHETLIAAGRERHQRLVTQLSRR